MHRSIIPWKTRNCLSCRKIQNWNPIFHNHGDWQAEISVFVTRFQNFQNIVYFCAQRAKNVSICGCLTEIKNGIMLAFNQNRVLEYKMCLWQIQRALNHALCLVQPVSLFDSFTWFDFGEKALHTVTIGDSKLIVTMRMFSARTAIKTIGNNGRVANTVHAPFGNLTNHFMRI